MATIGVFNFMRLKEGCDPAKVAHLYLRDAAARTYVPLDAATYAAIVAGTRPLG